MNAAQIFLLETSQFTDNDINLLLLSLPKVERERAEAITRAHRKIEFVCGRYLIRKVLHEKFQLNLPNDLALNKNEKPFAHNVPPFNISHSKKFVSFVLSAGEEIGLDIETENQNRDIFGIINNFGTESEIKEFENCTPERQKSFFYNLWSLKESFAKATGTGLNSSLKNLKFNLLNSKVLESPLHQQCVFFYTQYNALHIAVTILAKQSAQPIVWQVNKVGSDFTYTELKDLRFQKLS